MSGIRGIVLLTRFDYIEMVYGRERLKQFISKLQGEDTKILNQPIVISKEYPEALLKSIDETMMREFFDNDQQKFLELGYWNARQVVPRYFQIYIDERNPAGFLTQMMRMRPVLIGLGDMHVTFFDKRDAGIHINYGQPFSVAVKLTELGFLEEGCRLCGAARVHVKEMETKEVSVEYEIRWEM